jgi:hypothetical protein
MVTVEGIYKDGRVILLKKPEEIANSKVLITFIEESDAGLATLGIDEDEALELRQKFSAFDDWNDPVMDVYNDYDNARKTVD